MKKTSIKIAVMGAVFAAAMSFGTNCLAMESSEVTFDKYEDSKAFIAMNPTIEYVYSLPPDSPKKQPPISNEIPNEKDCVIHEIRSVDVTGETINISEVLSQVFSLE